MPNNSIDLYISTEWKLCLLFILSLLNLRAFALEKGGVLVRANTVQIMEEIQASTLLSRKAGDAQKIEIDDSSIWINPVQESHQKQNLLQSTTIDLNAIF